MSHTARRAHRCVTAALMAILATACDGDLIGQDRYGSPETWRLGPVERGSTVRLPTNPCPPSATTLRMQVGFQDYAGWQGPPPVVMEGVSVDEDDFSVNIPSDADLGTWTAIVTCIDAGGSLVKVDSEDGLLFEWEFEVSEPG